MDFNRIQTQLNNEFGYSNRRIVFWYDEQSEFMDSIYDLVLSNAKLFVLDGRNYFKCKYTIEIENPTSNYLIYAPFKQPIDAENPVLDILLYSKQFYADYYSILADDLNVPMNFKSYLSNYSVFFKSKSRINAFRNLGMAIKNQLSIDMAIMAVLSKSKIVDFSEIFKLVLNAGIVDNKVLSDFNTYGVSSSFWDCVERYFGYKDETPSLEKCMSCIFITNVYSVSEIELPNNKGQYVLNKVSESTVFLTNYKNNINTMSSFDSLSNSLSKSLDIHKMVKEMSIEEIKNNDVFKDFDEKFIVQLIDYGKNQVNLDQIETYMSYRKNTHFFNHYENMYMAIYYGYKLLKSINEFVSKATHVDVLSYAKEYAYIDQYYDKYVFYQRKTSGSLLEEFDTLIENKYNSVFLEALNSKWDKKLIELGDYSSIYSMKQMDFYDKIACRYNEKTCVIISDALRYEVGLQLNEYLESKAKYDTDISPMISTIPSYTELGMAALLPNIKLTINDDYSVTINERKTNSTELRNRILSGRNPEAMAISFEEMKSITGQKNIRERLKGIKLLYIYHNQIDARGDHAPSENEVFDAANASLFEIEAMIRKLTNDAFFTRFVVTADHGFIYRRKKIDEADKLDFVKTGNEYVNKRYIYSKANVEIENTIKYNMKYLKGTNDMYAYVPKAMNLIKSSGSGQNYVHGGASLQEIVVPVINVKTTYRGVATKFVNVNCLSAAHKITSISTQISFVQTETVDDKTLARNFKVFFVDANNNKISNECSIYGNSTSEDVRERITICKFNFVEQQYSTQDTYYMIIQLENGMEYARIPYIVDIPFMNDFGFDF